MKAIEFEQQNGIYGKNQQEFEQLPAYIDEEQGASTFRFKLSEEEVQQVKETGEIWITVLNHKQPLQPIAGTILNPFRNIIKVKNKRFKK